MKTEEAATISVGDEALEQMRAAAILNGRSVEEAMRLAFALAWRYGEVYSRGGRVLWQKPDGTFSELTIAPGLPNDFYGDAA